MASDSTTPPKTTRGRPRRTQAEADDLRARITQAARNLFARNGYEGVSMRKLADEAGCAPAALYSVFPNKRAVLHVVWEGVFADLAALMQDTARAHENPVARLEALGIAMTRFWLQRPDDFRAIFLIEDQPAATDNSYFATTSPAVANLALIEDAAEDAVAAGRMEAGTAQLIASALVAAVNGLALNLITIPEYDWADESAVVDRTIRALIAGFTQG